MDFEKQLEACRLRLRKHLLTLGRCREDVEDLEQRTLLRAWQSRGTYSGTHPMIGWLIRIATNLNLDMGRSASCRVECVSFEDAGIENGELLDVVADDSPGIEALLAFRSDLATEMEKVKEITTSHDHVLIQDILDGKTISQMAAEWGSTRLAVQHRTHRLYKRLAQRQTA